jgi:hypothetical protein
MGLSIPIQRNNAHSSEGDLLGAITRERCLPRLLRLASSTGFSQFGSTVGRTEHEARRMESVERDEEKFGISE